MAKKKSIKKSVAQARKDQFDEVAETFSEPATGLRLLYDEFRRGRDVSPGDPDGPEFISWLEERAAKVVPSSPTAEAYVPATVEGIKKAIDRLFSDKTVSRSKAKEQLEDIQVHLEIMVDDLDDEGLDYDEDDNDSELE